MADLIGYFGFAAAVWIFLAGIIGIRPWPQRIEAVLHINLSHEWRMAIMMAILLAMMVGLAVAAIVAGRT